MIEINLQKLDRGTHKGPVKVTRDGKTFTQYRRVGKKEPEKNDNPRSYSNMPGAMVLSPDLVQSMNKTALKSMSMEREISTSLDINSAGEMVLGSENVGDKDSCSVNSGIHGMWHSHPGTEAQNTDTFSLFDIVTTVRHGLPIMMAQTCHNGRVWMTVKTDDVEGVKDKRKKLNKWEALGYTSTSEGKSGAKHYRNLVKDFCDEFKLKLYTGKGGNLKEYDGTW